LNSLTNIGTIVLTVILNILPFHIWAQEIEFSVYEDPEGEFTIEYPLDWHVNEEPNKSVEDIVVQFDSSEPRIVAEMDLTMPNVMITVRDPLPDETSLEALSNKLVNFTAQAGKVGESKYTTLSGLRAYTITNVLFDIHSKSVWTIHNDKVYGIIYNAHSYDYEIYLPTFQRMIESFHMTK
jgi:hypothetical protein